MDLLRNGQEGELSEAGKRSRRRDLLVIHHISTSDNRYQVGWGIERESKCDTGPGGWARTWQGKATRINRTSGAS